MKINYSSRSELVPIGSLKPGNTYYDPIDMKHYMVCTYEKEESSHYIVDFSVGTIYFNKIDPDRLVRKTNVEANVNNA